MKFLTVAGTRPNFMKIAPLHREFQNRDHEFQLVHTGQHYDESMSGDFFADLEMDPPDYNLGVGSGTHAQQTARIMEEIEPIIDRENPEIVVVVGDVNSTLAAGLVASKKSTRLAHVEAGIRSRNRNMPEEINRLVVDRVSDLLFCFDDQAVENLRREGISKDKIHLVGDIMIDSLKFTLRNVADASVPLDLPAEYALLTLHRPSNVDRKNELKKAFSILSEASEQIPIVFPIHPRTSERLESYGMLTKWKENFEIIEPLGHRDFVGLMRRAEFVMTDSGSIQQETTVMDIPCLTLRDETERAITVRKGSNRVVGMDRQKILNSINEILQGDWPSAEQISLWDGRTAERVVDVFERALSS